MVTPGPAAAQAPDPQRLFREAAEAQERGDLDAAVRKYQQLIRLHPEIIGARQPGRSAVNKRPIIA